MAFDGITVTCITKELQDHLLEGRIQKIAQPENDELIITIKNNRTSYYLVLSASASLPLLYLTDSTKQNPMTAPNFCMLLRKHIGSGKIIGITQPELERIVDFEIEHRNELGDLCRKILTIEIMGKHSNIIFREEDKIIDSIKHVSGNMSSVREVLPGRTYFIPKTQEKLNPLTIQEADFFTYVYQKPMGLIKALTSTFTGMSSTIASEICFRASIDGDFPANTLSNEEQLHLYRMFSNLMDDVKEGTFTPNIIRDGKEPIEFSPIHLQKYSGKTIEDFTSISKVLQAYYSDKEKITRIRQKSADLRKIVQTSLERSYKKFDLQKKQLEDTKKKDKYKVYGELINTYGYQLEAGAKSLTALNYYTNEEITIPLDDTLSSKDNAKKYFDRYNKLKRTYEALSSHIQETQEEIDHLESIRTALDIAQTEDDFSQIKEELMDYGYIKKKVSGKKQPKLSSSPLHYVSSDGFSIYVGKNNFQNEELTFKFATGNDWWFHAKGIPGSHVIVKGNGEEMLPDATFEEAGRLAAYYSKNRMSKKVEVDYTQKKNVKKPAKGKPGFVVYYTNYSLMIDTDISNIHQE